MKTKIRSYSPPGEARQGRKERWQRCRWLGLLVMLVMLAGSSQTAKADTPRWNFPTSSLNIANPYIQIGFYVLEDDGAWSYWGSGDFNLYLNDHPLDMEGFIVGRDGTSGWGSWSYRKGKWWQWYSQTDKWGVAANPWVWYNSDKEYWATLLLVPRYIFIDYKI